MTWLTRQLREKEREQDHEFLHPKSNRPKLKVPRDFHCNDPGCVQPIGGSMCRMNRKTGKPCKWWTKLQEMAKTGVLEVAEDWKKVNAEVARVLKEGVT